jgi:hypothetical protein
VHREHDDVAWRSPRRDLRAAFDAFSPGGESMSTMSESASRAATLSAAPSIVGDYLMSVVCRGGYGAVAEGVVVGDER